MVKVSRDANDADGKILMVASRFPHAISRPLAVLFLFYAPADSYEKIVSQSASLEKLAGHDLTGKLMSAGAILNDACTEQGQVVAAVRNYDLRSGKLTRLTHSKNDYGYDPAPGIPGDRTYGPIKGHLKNAFFYAGLISLTPRQLKQFEETCPERFVQTADLRTVQNLNFQPVPAEALVQSGWRPFSG